MKFFKIGYNGGGGFLLEMGVWFYNGGWLTFKASLYCWQRGANPLFYEDPLYCISSLFQMLSTPQTSLSPPTLTSTVLSVAMFP